MENTKEQICQQFKNFINDDLNRIEIILQNNYDDFKQIKRYIENGQINPNHIGLNVFVSNFISNLNIQVNSLIMDLARLDENQKV